MSTQKKGNCEAQMKKPEALMLPAFSVFLRGDAHVVFEYFCKIALIFESAQIGNLNKGEIVIRQEQLALLDPDSVDIIGNGFAGLGFENIAKIGFT